MVLIESRLNTSLTGGIGFSARKNRPSTSLRSLGVTARRICNTPHMPPSPRLASGLFLLASNCVNLKDVGYSAEGGGTHIRLSLWSSHPSSALCLTGDVVRVKCKSSLLLFRAEEPETPHGVYTMCNVGRATSLCLMRFGLENATKCIFIFCRRIKLSTFMSVTCVICALECNNERENASSRAIA